MLLKAAGPAVKRLYTRSERDFQAASALVRRFELQADEWRDDTPLWHGWAIHQAFLLGMAYAEREAKA